MAQQESGQLPGSRASWNWSAGKGGGEGPGQPCSGEKSQLEPSRDRKNMRETVKNPFQT
jgi:hypothetical protein